MKTISMGGRLRLLAAALRRSAYPRHQPEPLRVAPPAPRALPAAPVRWAGAADLRAVVKRIAPAV